MLQLSPFESKRLLEEDSFTCAVDEQDHWKELFANTQFYFLARWYTLGFLLAD